MICLHPSLLSLDYCRRLAYRTFFEIPTRALGAHSFMLLFDCICACVSFVFYCALVLVKTQLIEKATNHRRLARRLKDLLARFVLSCS